MALEFNTNHPSINDLRTRAQKRIPKFAFECLENIYNQDLI